MTNYTIIDGEGYEIETGLGLLEAADAVMTSDSRQWQLRCDDDGYWAAWACDPLARRWTQTVFSVWADTEDEARTEISKQIINMGRMKGHYEAVLSE